MGLPLFEENNEMKGDPFEPNDDYPRVNRVVNAIMEMQDTIEDMYNRHLTNTEIEELHGVLRAYEVPWSDLLEVLGHMINDGMTSAERHEALLSLWD